MAGDWIKMRQDLRDDPAVVKISLMTETEEDAVVGKLHRLWCWADKHTTDGNAPAITKNWVDRYVGKSGFSDAMVAAGWLSFSDDGVCFPSFDIHNGQSAKTRAEAAIRQRLSRKNRDEGMTGVERTSIPKPFIRHVLNRDNYTCVYCGTESDEATESSRKARLSIDHIIPETRGGSASVANLACCCRKCNSEKNDRTPEEWGLEPTFLQQGVTYKDGQMSQKNRDSSVTESLPEKRREENIENTDMSPAKLPTCPTSLVIQSYHDHLPTLSTVRLQSEARTKAVSTFWKWVLTSKRADGTPRAETAEQALQWIGEYFNRANDNDFLMGRNAQSGKHANWKADFDFLLTEKGKRHVIEKTGG